MYFCHACFLLYWPTRAQKTQFESLPIIFKWKRQRYDFTAHVPELAASQTWHRRAKRNCVSKKPGLTKHGRKQNMLFRKSLTPQHGRSATKDALLRRVYRSDIVVLAKPCRIATASTPANLETANLMLAVRSFKED